MLEPVIEKAQFAQALQTIRQTNIQKQQDAFLEYGYDWNVI